MKYTYQEMLFVVVVPVRLILSWSSFDNSNVTGQASTPLGVDSLDPLVRPSISIAIVPLYDLFNVAD